MEETTLQRVRKVFESSGMTKTAIGDKLHVTPQYVWKIMNHDSEPSERLLLSVVAEFGVSEKWLRTGAGEMYPPKTKGEEIGEIVRAAAGNNREEAVEYFTDLLGDLTDGEIMLMYEIFKRHFPKK